MAKMRVLSAIYLAKENAGMRCMFTMMNNARLAVGLEGLGIAERAYQQALAYAKERVQGRPIIEHGDVQRMLVDMKSKIAAMRAICLYASAEVDRSISHDDAETGANKPAGRVALLTPIVKAWCTDTAIDITSTALQIHGGMGFIEETGIAQHYRDARITPIYEGTNGVQAMDLITRKLSMEGGNLPNDLIDELQATASPEIADILEKVRATANLIQTFEPEDRAAAAKPFLDLFASALAAALLDRGAQCANSDPRGKDWPAMSNYFNQTCLLPALARQQAIKSGHELIKGIELAA